jgi:hypothetical protein
VFTIYPFEYDGETTSRGFPTDEATTLATLTDACPAFNTHPNPLFDLHIPLFVEGEFSPNLGMVLGLPPYASVSLFYTILIGGTCWLWRKLPKEGEKANLWKT